MSCPVLAPVLLLFTAVMMIFAGPVVWAMTGGFQDASPEKYRLATEFTRITFPYLMLISLTSLLGGILNSLDRFWVNAAAPILLNLCLIVGLLFFRGDDQIATARTQSIAVTVSGILQFLWLIWACHRAGVHLRLRLPRLTPAVRRLLRVIWPAAVGAGAVQFNLVISTSLAARFLEQGSVSYLYYADRLNQLPLGLVGIGVGTAILPSLSRQIASEDEAAATRTQNRAIELVLILTLPAAAALMVSAMPIIQALLQHGAFTAHDTVASAEALSAFSLGLPAYVLIKVLTPGFYARADTRTPVRIAILAMLINLALNLVLIWPMRHVGLALSTAVAAWVNAALLYWTLRRRGHFAIDQRLARTSIRIVVATLVMTAVLWLLGPWIMPWLLTGWVTRILALSARCSCGRRRRLSSRVAILIGALSPARAARPVPPTPARLSRERPARRQRHPSWTSASYRASSPLAAFTSAITSGRSAIGCGCRTRLRPKAGSACSSSPISTPSPATSIRRR